MKSVPPPYTVRVNLTVHGGGIFVTGKLLDRLKSKTRRLKQDVFVLYLSFQDKRTPWFAKWFAICVVAYAFSPIDLIPDFIPVLGYIDDLILVPLGIMLAIRMIPDDVLEECRAKAEELRRLGKPKNWIAGIIIIVIWMSLAAWLGVFLYKHWF